MLTVFSIPKPFNGHIGIIQQNAIRSWTLLRPRPEIILLGDEPGTAEIAQELYLWHIAEVERNEYGTPLVSSVFSRGEKAAANRLLCYVNADIILLSSFIQAVEQVGGRLDGQGFLMVGRRWNVQIEHPWDYDDPAWEAKLRAHVDCRGVLHPPSGLDYFLFPKGTWGSVPPFALGRTRWDSWFVYRARERGLPVIDATSCARVVHQQHDYSHVSGGEASLKHGSEARENLRLRGGFARLYTTCDATYVLTPQGLRPAPLRYRLGAVYLRGVARTAYTLTHTLYPYSYPVLVILRGLRRLRSLFSGHG